MKFPKLSFVGVTLILLSQVAFGATVASAPPSAPTVKAIGADNFISWTTPLKNSDGTTPAHVDGYNVYRDTSSAMTNKVKIAGAQGNAVLANVLSYTDKGAANSNYFYAIQTWYCPTSGCAESGLSPITSSKTTPSSPAHSVGETITLTWEAPLINVNDNSPVTTGEITAYNVYSITGSGTATVQTKIASVAGNVLTYTTPLYPPGTYSFSVTAVAGSQESGKSGVINSTISNSGVKIPESPSNLKVR